MDRKEWGSNFCEEIGIAENCLYDEKQKLYFDTGRSALRYLLHYLKVERKRVLLPQYICESVITPFKEMMEISAFYPVTPEFEIKQNIFEKYIQEFKPEIVFVQSCFGFDTLNGIRDYLNKLREKGMVVIEDITHSIFSYNWTDCSDYKIGSLRKWCSIPDGGVLVCCDKSRHGSFPREELQENTLYVRMRLEAQKRKRLYLSETRQETEDLKGRFISLFDKSEEILDKQETYFTMSAYTRERIKSVHWAEIAQRRRENYDFIEAYIYDIPDIEPVGLRLEENTVPLYYPIYVRNNKRHAIRLKMKQYNIMLPVIWPLPSELQNTLDFQVKEIYDGILAIPCDQRYDREDMELIIKRLKECMEELKTI